MKKICFVTEKKDDLLSTVFLKFGEAFHKLGISSMVAYFGNPQEFQATIVSLMNDENLLFYVGFNGFGANITVLDTVGKEILLWEKIKKPFFNLQADPCFVSEMYANTANSYNPYRVDFLGDRMNMHWLVKMRKSVKNIYSESSFSTYIKTEAENKYKNILDRPIKSLLCLTLCDPEFFLNRIKSNLHTDSKLYFNIFDNIIDLFENDLRSDPVLWSDVTFQTEGLSFDISNKTHRYLLSEAWHYIRMKRRYALLNSLSDFPLYLITSHQLLSTAKLHRETSINTPVNFSQYINLLSHSQIHICPPTQYYGFHERQAISMYQRCVTISPPNVAFEEKLSHGNDILFYHNLNEDLSSVMSNILTKEDDIQRISSNARKSAEENFSPRKTALRFINVYKSLLKTWR